MNKMNHNTWFINCAKNQLSSISKKQINNLLEGDIIYQIYYSDIINDLNYRWCKINNLKKDIKIIKVGKFYFSEKAAELAIKKIENYANKDPKTSNN
jgi:hypothetical protein